MLTTQEIKQRINKLDFHLKEIFENVIIKEKSVGNQFFFKIDCNGQFWNLFESKAYQRVEVNIIIHKSDLVKDPVQWSYSSDPTNEDAHWVNKISVFEKLALDIEDIVLNCRMDESYIKELPYIIEEINENTTYFDGDGNVIKNKLISMGVLVDEVDQDDKIVLEDNSFMKVKPEKTYSFYHHSEFTMADKFVIEQEINKVDGVNYTIFKDGVIQINFTPVQ